MHGLRLFLQIPNVSTLTFADEQLFRAAISTQSLRYAHSWLYMLRAAHLDEGGMGFKYVTPELVAVIGYRHEHIYVTPLFDTTGGAKLGRLCHDLHKNVAVPVIIRKLSEASLVDLPFSTDDLDPGTVPLEDDTCAETLLQLNKLFISSEGEVNPMAKKLLRRAHAFEKQGITFQIIEDIKQIPFEKLEAFLAKDPEKYASYLPILQYLYKQPYDKYKYRVMVFTYRGRVRGLYMAEVLSLTELGLYGGITSKDVGGITEWMDLYYFHKVWSDGIKKIHLGGAENEGIAEYIHKLIPYKPDYISKSLLYNPAPKEKLLPVTVRHAKESDMHNLSILYRDFYNALNDLGEQWSVASARRFISYFYQRQPDLFFIAEYEDEIVGLAVAGLQPWWDGNRLVEGELVVDLRYGDTDINRRLLKELLTYASKKYQVVSWDTFTPTSNKHPLGAYEKVGFIEVPEWVAISGDVQTVLDRLNV